jgi:hypothetical protein
MYGLVKNLSHFWGVRFTIAGMRYNVTELISGEPLGVFFDYITVASFEFGASVALEMVPLTADRV